MLTAQRLGKAALKAFWLALPLLTLVAFIAAQVERLRPLTTVANLDYFPLLDRAVRLSFNSWDGWVHQIHPVGYSWLIRLGLELGWDAARVGQALSVAGGLLGLCGAYLLAISVFKDRRFAALASAYTAAMGIYLYFASVEGNDMPAAGIQLLSIGVLAAASLKPDSPGWRDLLVAGWIAGLAYVVRYTGLVTAMASGLWLVLAAFYEHRPAWPGEWKQLAAYSARLLRSGVRPALKALGVYTLAFFMVGALQCIPSWLATGTPFYHDQGQNVWFHVYEQTDFIREFNQAPAGITLTQVFLMDPLRFILHWWSAFQGFWVDTKLTLLDAPLKLFGQAGFIFLLLARGPASVKPRGLLAIFVLAHLASLSLMRLDRRFLLTMIPILTIGALYLFTSLIPPGWAYRRAGLPLNLVVLTAGLAWMATGLLGFAHGNLSPDWTVLHASDALYAAGMRSAGEVLSTHTRLQDARVPARSRFAQAYGLAPDQPSVPALVQTMKAKGWRFFIYDRDAGPVAYPALQDMLSPETRPPGLTPVYIPEARDLVIYRLADGDLGACAPLAAHFEAGMELNCYELSIDPAAPEGGAPENGGWQAGVYLHWQANSPTRPSLKVFVHVLAADGHLVAQDDSLPVVWTYPSSEWATGEVVVDFHRLATEAGLPPGQYTLQAGLYDEDSSRRLNRLDAAGQPVDDKAILTTFTLKQAD